MTSTKANLILLCGKISSRAIQASLALSLAFIAPEVKAQTLAQDTLAVRLTLNQNGHFAVPVSKVTSVVNGRVQSLHFDSLTMGTLSMEIFFLDSLKTFSMVHCGIASLPANLSQWKALTSLDLSHNALTTLPDDMGNLASLTQLKVRGNALATLPSSLLKLKNLLYLDIGANALKALPENIDSLRNLVHLLADQDSLTTLPTNLARLPFLRNLHVAGNRLSTLPFELAALDSLETLDLAFNEINALPATYALLTSVKTLDLTGNQICNAAADVKTWADARQPGWATTQLCADSTQSASLFRVQRGSRQAWQVSGLLASQKMGEKGSMYLPNGRQIGKTLKNHPSRLDLKPGAFLYWKGAL